MANQTPDSQLSAYEKINWLLSEQCEQSQVVEDNKNRSPCVLEGTPNTLGDTAIEHEHWQKQQRMINERVNAEAQRLRQAETCLAHQEKQKGRRSCFLWNEERTKALLDLMMELRMDYLNTTFTTSGFIAWSCYFKNNENHKKDLLFETLERRYKALMTTYRMIKDSSDATGGEGLYTQLQRYHMTHKQFNMNNCGMNCNGMELGNYTQEQVNDNNELTNENDWNRCRDNERENGHGDTEEEGQPNKNAQGTNEEMKQPGPSNFIQNIHASGRKNCRRSMRMLCPLMMMMQQNQERAEERDRCQMERDEEKRLQEECRCMEDESRRDRMNMTMLMMFARVTVVDPASMRDIYGG
ncbi:hypothetical protein O181_124149 [Austropuccinia psidii MF-1]|uniref:Uncharacterized protein n=1 Tax=Austropuccinia psidii MF-1 TaxID=1389203 RepID=A0A9Q3Q3Y9_9BASI|nr:hypothetical protein [Austropuccinia psidii MF-1]